MLNMSLGQKYQSIWFYVKFKKLHKAYIPQSWVFYQIDQNRSKLFKNDQKTI